jgi:hypothetical protein
MEQIAPKTAEIGGIWIGTELVRVQVSRMKIDADRRSQLSEKKKQSKRKKREWRWWAGWSLLGPAELRTRRCVHWLGCAEGPAGWAGLSPVGQFFFCFSIFVFLFSYFFHNFCILAPNELKPLSKFF